jgi:hypothetical protein
MDASKKLAAKVRRYEKDFRSAAEAVGLVAADLGRQLVFEGREFTLAGWDSSARHFRAVVRRADGSLGRMHVDTVRRCLVSL